MTGQSGQLLLVATASNTYGSGKIHHRREPNPKEWTEFHKPEPYELVYKPEDGYQIGNSKKMAFCPTANSLEEHPDYKVASYGVEVLSRRHEKPFFLAVGIVKPHLAFVCPQRFFDLYPKDVKPPRINPNDHDDIPAVGRAFAKISDDTKFKQDTAWTRVRRAYLACISWADYNVGRVLDALKANGVDEDTLVIFTSDSGPWLIKGEHGGSAKPLRDGKGPSYEGGQRVPCVMRWPAKIAAGTECSEVATARDLLPTFAAITGAKLPSDLKLKPDGHDIQNLMIGGPEEKTPYDMVFCCQPAC